MKLNAFHYLLIIIIVAAGVMLGWRLWQDKQPGKLDEFAACIADSGAKFYGAFWCPHCADQKKVFGNSVDLLPYVECSEPDGQSQTQECIDAGITGYPTWELSGGERLNGTQTLQKLAEKTGCELPE